MFPLLVKITAANRTTMAQNPPVLRPGSAASGFPGQAVRLRSLSKYVPCQQPGLGWRPPAGVLDLSSCTAVPLHLSWCLPTLDCGNFGLETKRLERVERGEVAFAGFLL